MGRLWRAVIVAVLGGGCVSSRGPKITVNVSALSASDWVPGSATFTVRRLRQGTPDELLENELLRYLRGRLELKGLVYDERAPQLVVSISAYVRPFEEYTPPRTILFPTSSTTSSGSGTRTTHGLMPITTPAQSRLQYFRSITIYVGQRKADGAVAPVWQGTVDSAGELADLMLVAPTMIRHGLTEFPRRSGYPSQRTVPIMTFDEP